MERAVLPQELAGDGEPVMRPSLRPIGLASGRASPSRLSADAAVNQAERPAVSAGAFHEAVRGEGPERTSARGQAALVTLIAALGLLVACALLARIMSFAIRHDEQFYVPAGALFTFAGLYRDFGFNHLPNLPILLSALYGVTGTHHYLLAGRLLTWVLWLVGGAVLALTARLATRSTLAGVVAIAFYVTNPVFLGPTGMTVTNNFLPVVLSLLGTYVFLFGSGCATPGRRAVCMALSGFVVAAAVGCKANYVFLVPCFGCAVLLAPSPSGIERVWRVVLPFTAGALVGALPALAYFISDPAGMWAHIVRYHRVAQIAYWAGDDDKVVGIGQKLGLAHQLWILGAGGLIPLGVATLLCVMGVRRGPRAMLAAVANLPFLLVAALVALGALVSFVPTPSFPQYYAPPIMFGIVLLLVVHGMLDQAEERQAVPFLIALLAFATLAGAPQLMSGIGRLAHPASWTGVRVHRDAQQLARQRGRRPGPVATLAPLYPIEAGLPIYPELAGGPFIYRVGDLLRASDAVHYRYLASPTSITSVLAATPPSAILLGMEGDLERPFAAFARAHGFREVLQPVSDGRSTRTILYLAPD